VEQATTAAGYSESKASMAPTNLNQGVPSLNEDQAKALTTKMEAFYCDLSPEEQVHVNKALRHMASDTSDVTGHASMSEFHLLLIAIYLLL
jgi:hypothetical protein